MKLCRRYFGLVEFAVAFQLLLSKSFLTCTGLEEVDQQHEKSTDKRHLLGHLGDWLDLDGQALRHIEDHLQSVADSRDDIKDIADGDNPKGLFYFFKIHDFDNNDKLDGLEWFKALTDFREVSLKHGGEDYDDSEVETMIDDLLRKHDVDEDGYISFIELLNDKPDSLFNELDKMDEDEEAQENNDTNESEKVVDDQGQKGQEHEKVLDTQDDTEEGEKLQDDQENGEERVMDNQEKPEENERVMDTQEKSETNERVMDTQEKPEENERVMDTGA